MAILIEPPANWGNLQGKPATLSDGNISWNEIVDIPTNLANFMTHVVTPKNKYVDFLLGVYQSSTEITYKWHLLKSSANSHSIAARDGGGNIQAINFVATAMPTSPNGLSTGSFWKDANGFVKIV